MRRLLRLLGAWALYISAKIVFWCISCRFPCITLIEHLLMSTKNPCLVFPYSQPKDINLQKIWEIFKTKRVYQMSLKVIILTHSWYIFSFTFGIFIESVIANILFTAGLLRVTRNDLFTMAYQNSARTAKLNHETD